MLAEDGAIVVRAEGVDAGLLLLVSLGTDAAAFHPRHAINLAAGARLTLLELSLGDGTYLHNPVVEVHVAEDAALTHVRLQSEAPAAFHLSTLYAEIAERGTYDSFALNLGGADRAHRGARSAGRCEGHRASEWRAVARRRAACRLHHGGEACRTLLHVAADGEECACRALAGRFPGAHRGCARGAEDRRLPDEPGAAAVARCRDRHQAGTGDLRRRCEVQPWRDRRRTGCRPVVLSAQPRHSGCRGAVDPGACLPRGGAGCRDATKRCASVLEHAVEGWWERQAA